MLRFSASSLDMLMALLLGVMVLADVYLLLDQVFKFNTLSSRRAAGIFAGAAGLATTLYLLGNPAFLQELVAKVVLALAGLLLATLALLRKRAV